MINKQLLLIPIIILTYSCSGVSGIPYNTPFINSTETTKLDFDMTKEEVLKILGEPLIVQSGTGSTKTIIWLYEVRTIEVLGERSTDLNIPYQPKKYNNKHIHDNPNHIWELQFINGKLENWGPVSSKNKRRK